jgi:hypothetical protein
MALALPAAAGAAPVLASASIRMVVTSPTSCDVVMALRIEGATEVEHRIEAFEGGEVLLGEVRGARPVGEPRLVGRTKALVVGLEQPEYEIRYRARQGYQRRHRCPVWLPTVPTTGRLHAVRLDVQLPDGSRPSSSMPALSWTGSIGTTALSHVPAFVRLPYTSSGEPAGWDLTGVMDGLALAVFAGASAIWLWRRRRGPWA